MKNNRVEIIKKGIADLKDSLKTNKNEKITVVASFAAGDTDGGLKTIHVAQGDVTNTLDVAVDLIQTILSKLTAEESAHLYRRVLARLSQQN